MPISVYVSSTRRKTTKTNLSPQGATDRNIFQNIKGA